MNLRCLYCQTPFTLSRAELLTAIVTMNEKHQNHYDAHCPRCRRANSISRQRMELFFPNWREAAKQRRPHPKRLPQNQLPRRRRHPQRQKRSD
jgi:phage FluMu protein Com